MSTTTIDVAQFAKVFLEEAAEHIGTLETALLELERTPQDSELLGRLFRAAHSIKGGAATFGFPTIAKFTHHTESLLDLMREGRVIATPALVDLMLRATDQLALMLSAADSEQSAELPGALVAELEAAVAAVGHGAAPAAAQPVAAAPVAAEQRYRVRFVPANDVMRTGTEPMALLRELARIGRIETVETELARIPAFDALDPVECYVGWQITLRSTCTVDAITEVFDFASFGAVLDVQVCAPESPAVAPEPGVRAAPPAPARAPGEANGGSIRVSVEKADKLVNLVGELVIHQSMVAELVRNFSKERLGHLVEAVASMERNTRELQERVMSIRMVPVGVVLNRFPRMVRDLAAQLHKRVEVELAGEDTELDKSVVEQIADPLTHLVRNAVDHGLESPEKRRAAGKPEHGTLQLSAYHQGGSIVIEVRDDGRGLDVTRIRAKAIENGLITGNEDLSEAATYGLIMRPGFSTAETVTDISGRGVGLDVVKRNIEALNGSVQITSEPGRGACFRIALPLTLAILDGLSLRVGQAGYVLPLTTIVESLRVRPEQYKRVLGRGELIDVRGESLPLVRLHRLFTIPDAVENPSEGLVVVVEHNGRKIGVLVDEITGQPQVVIKSLESHYRKVEGLMGATILGDGHVTLILDVPGLIRSGHAGASERSQSQPGAYA